MVFTWTRQFLMATGIFAFILTAQTVNMVVKEKQVAEKVLQEADRTVRVTSPSQIEFN